MHKFEWKSYAILMVSISQEIDTYPQSPKPRQTHLHLLEVLSLSNPVSQSNIAKWEGDVLSQTMQGASVLPGSAFRSCFVSPSYAVLPGSAFRNCFVSRSSRGTRQRNCAVACRGVSAFSFTRNLWWKKYRNPQNRVRVFVLRVFSFRWAKLEFPEMPSAFLFSAVFSWPFFFGFTEIASAFLCSACIFFSTYRSKYGA